ncbi:MAG: CHASE3 domain-containing protein [Aquabacterium sp.]
MLNALKGHRTNSATLVLAVLAAAALMFISEATYWQASSALARLEAGVVIRSNLRDVELGLTEAQSGMRSHLLTWQDDDLEPYFRGVRKANAALAELDRRYADDPPQKAKLGQMRAAAQAILDVQAATILLHDGGDREGARRQALDRAGEQDMDTVRRLGAGLSVIEDQVRARDRADLAAILGLSRIAMAALAAVGLVALFLFLRHSTVREIHRLALAQQALALNQSLDGEVKLRTAQLTELTQHLQTAREDERHRLARNLHDELGALLTSAKLDAARIRARLGSTAPEAQERLAHLVQTLDASIALGRSIIDDLRPSTLANLGLVAAVEILAREHAALTGVQVHCDLAPVKLRPSAELTVYRLVQEAITNVGKYASAGQVWIDLQPDAGQVRVCVRDDGVGFDMAAPAHTAYGLVGMRYRVEAEGGVLTVTSVPGQGTQVQAVLPETS